jgi:hypothetical protein
VGLLACHGGRSGSRSRTGLESRTGRSRARAVKRSRAHAGGSRRARLARGSRLRRCRRRILGVPPPSSLLPFPLPIPLSTDAMGIGLAGGVGAQLLIFTRTRITPLFSRASARRRSFPCAFPSRGVRLSEIDAYAFSHEAMPYAMRARRPRRPVWNPARTRQRLVVA